MSAENTPATPGEAERPYGTAAGKRVSFGSTLSWPRAAKVAGLAAAVAALAAASVAVGHMVRVVSPPTRAHSTSVVSPQRAPAP